jgi:hypothetical protein
MSDASKGQFPRKVKFAGWGLLGFMVVAGVGAYTVASLEDKAQQVAQSMGGTAEINGYQWHEGGVAAAEVVVSFPGGDFTLTSLKQGDKTTFETLSFDHVQAGPIMEAGAGSVLVDGFDEVSLSLSDIRSSSQDYPLFAGLEDRSVDLKASLARSEQDYMGSVTLNMSESGSIAADASLALPESQSEIESQAQFKAAIASSTMNSLSVTYRDSGAFDQFLDNFAQREGMTPPELERFLFMGIQGSLIPDGFKSPLQEFISDPSEITIHAAPQGRLAETPVAVMPMQLQELMMQGATTASLAKALGMTMTYLPK